MDLEIDSRRRWTAILVAVAGIAGSPWGATPSHAAAPEAPAGEPTPARPVIVVLVADDADPGLVGTLEAARTQLDQQGIDLRTVTAAPRRASAPGRRRIRMLTEEHAALGVFWIDTAGPDTLQVFLAAKDGTAFFRRVVHDVESEQARLEAVWLIIGSGGVALATGREVAMEAVEPPPDEPNPETKPAQEVPAADAQDPPPHGPAPTPAPGGLQPAASISLSYLGDGFAAVAPWQSGLVIGAGLDLWQRLRLGAEYGVLTPWPSGSPPVTWRHRMGAHAGVWGDVAPRLSLELRATASADLVHWRGNAGSGVRALGAAGPDALMRVAIVRGLALEIGLGFSVAFNRFAFVECDAAAATCEGDDRRVLADPWLIRPRARLGLVYRFGPGPKRTQAEGSRSIITARRSRR